MRTVNRSEHCGNSPKAEFVFQLIQESSNKELNFLLKEETINIESIVTHGKYAVCMLNAGGSYAIYFEFKSAGSKEVKNIKIYEERTIR